MDTAPLILVADDSELSREYIANILKPAGYRVIQAIDGGSALKVATEHFVDMAIIDHFMVPYGGFEFARKIQNEGLNLPLLLVTSEETSDLLIEAAKYGIGSYLRKPVDPQRLLTAVRRTLREKPPEEKSAETVLVSEIVQTQFTPDELMSRAIELARHNAETKHGGPYGAIVADADGRILGEGVNGITSRCDPIAHAEVMAIRQATEKLNKTDLEGCTLYSSSEPTTIGKALIDSVGISTVYYGLSHQDLRNYARPREFAKTEYKVLGQQQAATLFQSN